VLSLVALSCGNLIRHWNLQPMVNLMIYTFIDLPARTVIADIYSLKMLSVYAKTEQQARNMYPKKHLIFSKKTPV